MRISDWSSDVCSSDLIIALHDPLPPLFVAEGGDRIRSCDLEGVAGNGADRDDEREQAREQERRWAERDAGVEAVQPVAHHPPGDRTDERRVGKECVRTCRFRWSPIQ